MSRDRDVSLVLAGITFEWLLEVPRRLARRLVGAAAPSDAGASAEEPADRGDHEQDDPDDQQPVGGGAEPDYSGDDREDEDD